MALVLNQVSVGSAAQFIAEVTPNSTITLSVPSGGTVSVFVGQTNAVTTTNGFPVNPGGPQINFFLPPTAQAVNIWAITSSSAPLGVALLTTA